MTRAAIAVALVLIIAGLAYWQGGAKYREAQLQNEINTTNEVRDAQDACPSSMPFADRLRCLNQRNSALPGN